MSRARLVLSKACFFVVAVLGPLGGTPATAAAAQRELPRLEPRSTNTKTSRAFFDALLAELKRNVASADTDEETRGRMGELVGQLLENPAQVKLEIPHREALLLVRDLEPRTRERQAMGTAEFLAALSTWLKANDVRTRASRVEFMDWLSGNSEHPLKPLAWALLAERCAERMKVSGNDLSVVQESERELRWLYRSAVGSPYAEAIGGYYLHALYRSAEHDIEVVLHYKSANDAEVDRLREVVSGPGKALVRAGAPLHAAYCRAAQYMSDPELRAPCAER